jgi:pyruvate,water dikinase
MVARSAITNQQDIFWLTAEELSAVARELDCGERTRTLLEEIASRRSKWQKRVDLKPPYILPVGSKMKFWWRYVMPAPELRPQPDERAIHGLGISPGKVTSVARVINNQCEIGRLGEGEILVTHTTTPAWTPLFARAAGLVTDLGGPLAHGSIVAREYGIPAVMGTGSATKRVRDGQIITVDGTNGSVFQHSDPV